MRRRRVLAVAGLGIGGLLVGCVGGDDSDTPTETPVGMWELRARIANEDDEPRKWRVEARSPTGSAASASGTVPSGEAVEAGLAGLARDEELDVSIDSDAGAVSEPWRPGECRELFVDARIVDGMPDVDIGCPSET